VNKTKYYIEPVELYHFICIIVSECVGNINLNKQNSL